MFKNVKSQFIIKIIFSYLEECKKLKLIKSNKTLQNKLNITIINYKHIIGKYVIKEQNGLIKEYNGYDNVLIFEGRYLNGKRNGKGKEFYQNGLIKFEGEYLNGKRNGKGKEYLNDILIFEGEYKNGEKNGKGKQYYNSGELEFEGEYLNDRILFGKKYDKNNWKKFNLNYINFKGKEYDDNGKLVFEGEYLNGQKNGKGKEYWNNSKLKFEGEYLNDKRNGYVK